jgi:hypothetical protein
VISEPITDDIEQEEVLRLGVEWSPSLKKSASIHWIVVTIEEIIKALISKLKSDKTAWLDEVTNDLIKLAGNIGNVTRSVYDSLVFLPTCPLTAWSPLGSMILKHRFSTPGSTRLFAEALRRDECGGWVEKASYQFFAPLAS